MSVCASKSFITWNVCVQSQSFIIWNVCKQILHHLECLCVQANPSSPGMSEYASKSFITWNVCVCKQIVHHLQCLCVHCKQVIHISLSSEMRYVQANHIVSSPGMCIIMSSQLNHSQTIITRNVCVRLQANNSHNFITWNVYNYEEANHSQRIITWNVCIIMCKQIIHRGSSLAVYVRMVSSVT